MKAHEYACLLADDHHVHQHVNRDEETKPACNTRHTQSHSMHAHHTGVGLCVRIYIHIYMRIRMYVCIYVCMYVCVYVCKYIIYVCTCA